MNPWKIAIRHSGWYVVGLDVDKNEQRLFKLSRIVGKVVRAPKQHAGDIPETIDISSLAPHDGKEARVALLAVSHGKAHAIRARGEAVTASVPDGFDAIEVPYFNRVEFSEDLAGLAGSVLVISPRSLRDDVVARIRSAAGVVGDPSVAPEVPAAVEEK